MRDEEIRSANSEQMKEEERVQKIGRRRLVTVRKFGQIYKLIYHNTLNGGFKNEKRVSDRTDKSDCEEDGEGTNDRLGNNISRARSRCRELALCNKWDYFGTFTFSPEKCNRYDLTSLSHKLRQWLGNYKRRYAPLLRYLLIPEQHKDGAFHLHGLVSGIPPSELGLNKYGYLDWHAYARRFGFVSLSPVRDAVRVAAYITKYITKDIGATAHKRAEHMFYASLGLKGSEVVGSFWSENSAEYEAEHCGLTWTRQEDDILNGMLQMLEATADADKVEAIGDAINALLLNRVIPSLPRAERAPSATQAIQLTFFGKVSDANGSE